MAWLASRVSGIDADDDGHRQGFSLAFRRIVEAVQIPGQDQALPGDPVRSPATG